MNKIILSLSILLYIFLSTQSIVALDTSHEPYYIGEVGEKWEFPSDHLPIGLTVDDFHIVFWNILNKKYLEHIEENTQGLKDGSILRDNTPVSSKGTLTIREKGVIDQIFKMMTHPTHPRSLVALQETHQDVLEYFAKNLPSNWAILTPPDQPKSQDIFIYNKELFEFISHDAVKYKENLPKSIFTVTLREIKTGKTYRFIQSHIPGGPINSAEGCAKFSQTALSQFNSDYTIVLMGDMNQSPSVIEKALHKAAKKAQVNQPYQYVAIEYPSHINTELQASWFDNFFVYKPSNATYIQSSNNPEELFESLVPITKLLRDY